MHQKTASILSRIKKATAVESGIISKMFGGKRPFDPLKSSAGEISSKKKKAAFPLKKGKPCKKTILMMMNDLKKVRLSTC